MLQQELRSQDLQADNGRAGKGQEVMELLQVLWHCFRQNYHADKANASIHCSSVRFSPITFRLAETLKGLQPQHLSPDAQEVLFHAGKYEEDKGRG